MGEMGHVARRDPMEEPRLHGMMIMMILKRTLKKQDRRVSSGTIGGLLWTR
jgi:hypothetical protein